MMDKIGKIITVGNHEYTAVAEVDVDELQFSNYSIVGYRICLKRCGHFCFKKIFKGYWKDESTECCKCAPKDRSTMCKICENRINET